MLHSVVLLLIVFLCWWKYLVIIILIEPFFAAFPKVILGFTMKVFSNCRISEMPKVFLCKTQNIQMYCVDHCSQCRLPKLQYSAKVTMDSFLVGPNIHPTLNYIFILNFVSAVIHTDYTKYFQWGGQEVVMVNSWLFVVEPTTYKDL